MKTVHNYVDVHKMKPVEMPVFSIISRDEKVMTEITSECIDNFSVSEDSINITTKNMICLSDPSWDVNDDKDFNYCITYNQIFKDNVSGDTVLLEKKYYNYYLEGYTTFGSDSTERITYSYTFFNEETHYKFKKEEK